MNYRTLAIAPLFALLLLGQPARASASGEGASGTWPEPVVVLEQLEPLTRFQFRLRGLVVKGKVTGPTIVKAHVDATGTVLRASLHTSSGNADLDEVALHGMRDMRFKPYMADGAAIPVTLVAPIHVPARLGRTHQ